MPYLEEGDKYEVDAHGLNQLLEYCIRLELKYFAGVLNYIIFKIVRRWIKQNGRKYFCFATIVGTMICSVLEIYRRLIAPYEDTKIAENGDVE